MSKIPSGPEKQNRPGIGRYRERLHNRALYVCNDERFRKGLTEARGKWNAELTQKQQRFHIVPVAQIADIQDRGALTSLWKSVGWEDPDALHPQRSGPGFVPRGLFSNPDGKGLSERWVDTILAVCTQFFPDTVFGVDRESASMLAYPHPAFLFVSACMFCDPRSIKADSLENGAVDWFGWIQSGSEATTLPYKPRYYDRHLLGIARIQRDFWKDLAIDLFQKLGAADEDIRWVEDQAVIQSAQILDTRLRDLGVVSPSTDTDRSTWTTIVHLNSLLSSDDLRTAEPQWLAKVREKTNAASLDTLIREVARDGYSQRDIANMFGISVGTVNKALNREPEGVQKPDDN